MIIIFRGANSALSVLIALLLAVGFIPREIAVRLVPLQKLLAKEIERRTRK